MSSFYNKIIQLQAEKKHAFFLLLDPDNVDSNSIISIVKNAVEQKVDAIFVGGSILLNSQFENCIQLIKSYSSDCPVVIFPGNSMQVSQSADAILFLSLISGRNPEYLINQQVLSAAGIKKSGIESISTAYMLIESGVHTSVEFMSNTRPIPRDKTDIAVAHAIAAELMGFKLIYLEAGSGAKQSVPKKMIQAIRKYVDLPIIVGGGIKNSTDAREKVDAGATCVVCGTLFENNNYNFSTMKEIIQSIKA